MRGDEDAEVPRRNRDELEIGRRDDRRRPRSPGRERQLAEGVARPERADELAADGNGTDAVEDDEESDARLALRDDEIPLAVYDALRPARKSRDDPVVQAGERARSTQARHQPLVHPHARFERHEDRPHSRRTEEIRQPARRGSMNSTLDYEAVKAYEADLIRLAARERVGATPTRRRRVHGVGGRLFAAIRARARVAAPRAATSKG